MPVVDLIEHPSDSLGEALVIGGDLDGLLELLSMRKPVISFDSGFESQVGVIVLKLGLPIVDAGVIRF